MKGLTIKKEEIIRIIKAGEQLKCKKLQNQYQSNGYFQYTWTTNKY